MSSLVSILEAQGVVFPLKYYGQHDYATGEDVKTLIEHADLIIQYYETNPLVEIISENALLDYYVLVKIIKFEELIPLIIEETNRLVLSELINISKIKLSQISNRTVIAFLNSSIEWVFQDKQVDFDLIDVVMNTIILYQNGIFDFIFAYIIENHNHLIFDHYDEISNRIKKSDNLYRLLFGQPSIKHALQYRRDELYKVFVLENNPKDTERAKVIKDGINLVINEQEEMAALLTEDNVMTYLIDLKATLAFLQKIGHVKANTFLTYVQKANELLDGYLQHSGNHYSYDIPVDKIMQALRDDTTPWFARLLKLTHSPSHETQSLLSSLNVPSEGVKGLVDLASTNIPTDEYFTMSHQQYLNIHIDVGTAAFYSLCKDSELFQNSHTWILSYLKFIYEHAGCIEDDYKEDLAILYQMLNNIFYLDAESSPVIRESLCYGACMFICAYTEKLSRVILSSMLREIKYIPSDKATMGELFSDSNLLFVKILGMYQIKHLKYFFCTYGDKKVGLNYRNKLAHWAEIDHEELTPFFVARLMFLFVNVVNSFFVYFYTENLGGLGNTETLEDNA